MLGEHRPQRGLELGPLHEVVVGLQRDVGGQALLRGDRQRRLEPRRREVGRPDLPHLARAHEPVERGEGLLLRGVRVVLVCPVEVDAVGLQAAQRLVGGGGDVRGREPGTAGERADLRGEDDVVAAAAGGEPLADDRLGGTDEALPPVGVGGVDEAAARVDVRVEHRERRLAVGGPAERVGPEPQPVPLEITHVIGRYPDVEALALSWVECQSYGRSDTATAGCLVHPHAHRTP